jgi:hypothetical protein
MLLNHARITQLLTTTITNIAQGKEIAAAPKNRENPQSCNDLTKGSKRCIQQDMLLIKSLSTKLSAINQKPTSKTKARQSTYNQKFLQVMASTNLPRGSKAPVELVSQRTCNIDSQILWDPHLRDVRRRPKETLQEDYIPDTMSLS